MNDANSEVKVPEVAIAGAASGWDDLFVYGLIERIARVEQERDQLRAAVESLERNYAHLDFLYTDALENAHELKSHVEYLKSHVEYLNERLGK